MSQEQRPVSQIANLGVPIDHVPKAEADPELLAGLAFQADQRGAGARRRLMERYASQQHEALTRMNDTIRAHNAVNAASRMPDLPGCAALVDWKVARRQAKQDGRAHFEPGDGCAGPDCGCRGRGGADRLACGVWTCVWTGVVISAQRNLSQLVLHSYSSAPPVFTGGCVTSPLHLIAPCIPPSPIGSDHESLIAAPNTASRVFGSPPPGRSMRCEMARKGHARWTMALIRPRQPPL